MAATRNLPGRWGGRGADRSDPAGLQALGAPLWEPPSGEIESLLFALQAAIGAGLVGFYFGRRSAPPAPRTRPEFPAMRDIDRIAQTGRWKQVAAGEKLLFLARLHGPVARLSRRGAQLVILISVLGVHTVRRARSCLGCDARGPRAGAVHSGGNAGAGGVPVLFGRRAVSLARAGRRRWRRPVSSRCAARRVSRRCCFLALTTPLTAILQFLQRLGLNRDISDIALIMFRIIWLTLDCLESGQRSLAGRLGDVGARRAHSQWRPAAGGAVAARAGSRRAAGARACGARYDGGWCFSPRKRRPRRLGSAPLRRGSWPLR